MRQIQVRHGNATLVNYILATLLLSIMGGVPRSVLAQETDISGRVYADYYWVAASHDEDLEGRNGFWFRRIYLTLDREIADQWAVRVRGEMDQPGDFTSDAKMAFTVKDAYLQWSNEQHAVYLGLVSTPTFGLLEDTWGYRSVEKTPLDLYDFASSRDIGVSAVGELGTEMPVRYHLMLANGSGTGTEINTGKKAMLSLAISPRPSLTVEVYGDIEGEGDQAGYYTLQGALYYRRPEGQFGVVYAHQTQYQEALPDAGYDIVSVFGRVRLNDRVNALLRYDRQFQANPFAEGIEYFPFASSGEANFVIAGLDFAVTDDIRVIPNVEAAFYSGSDAVGGARPDPDVLPRLTFHYRF